MTWRSMTLALVLIVALGTHAQRLESAGVRPPAIDAQELREVEGVVAAVYADLFLDEPAQTLVFVPVYSLPGPWQADGYWEYQQTQPIGWSVDREWLREELARRRGTDAPLEEEPPKFRTYLRCPLIDGDQAQVDVNQSWGGYAYSLRYLCRRVAGNWEVVDSTTYSLACGDI